MNAFPPAKPISWSAILIGMSVAIAVQGTLTLLGAALGLALVSPYRSDAGGISIGAGIWWTVTSAFSLFVGGCLAGKLSRGIATVGGCIHGLGVWAVGTVLTTVFLSAALGGLTAASAVSFGSQNSTSQMTSNNTYQDQAGSDFTRSQTGSLRGGEVTPDKVESAKRAAAGAALWSFIALLLSGIAAAAGGVRGERATNGVDAMRVHVGPEQQPA